MFLRRLKKLKLKKLIWIYYCFWKNYYIKPITFQIDYTFCFYPTTPKRQIHFNVINIISDQSQNISSGTLLKPHFTQYHSMKKNFSNLQKIVYLLWLFMEDIRSEPFYFFIKNYNNLTYLLLHQMRIIFNGLNAGFIINKAYNYTSKYRKRIKKKTWKMLLQDN